MWFRKKRKTVFKNARLTDILKIRQLQSLNSIEIQRQLKWPLKAAYEVWKHFFLNDLPQLVKKHVSIAKC